MKRIYRFKDSTGVTKVVYENDASGAIQTVYCSAPAPGFKAVDQVVVGDTIGDNGDNGFALVVATVEVISRFIFVVSSGARVSVPVDGAVCSHAPKNGSFEPHLVEVGWTICVMEDHDNPVGIVSIETIV